jgi:hypothetical protein
MAVILVPNRIVEDYYSPNARLFFKMLFFGFLFIDFWQGQAYIVQRWVNGWQWLVGGCGVG